MQEVLSHPLGPLPWSLTNADGSLKKTNKAALGKALEKTLNCVTTDKDLQNTATIIDGMMLVQKANGENLTFAQLGETLLAHVMHSGRPSKGIGVVFDNYLDNSNKWAESIQRGSPDNIQYDNIQPGHRIKQWRCFLACSASKTKLIQF